MFDLTRRQSMEDLEHWIREARQHASLALSVGLVGTKLDVCEEHPSR